MLLSDLTPMVITAGGLFLLANVPKVHASMNQAISYHIRRQLLYFSVFSLNYVCPANKSISTEKNSELFQNIIAETYASIILTKYHFHKLRHNNVLLIILFPSLPIKILNGHYECRGQFAIICRWANICMSELIQCRQH